MGENKNPPGTERFRDEQRDEKTPRMHGGPWHDHEEVRDLDTVANESLDAAPEVQSGGDLEGMGHGKQARDGKRGSARAEVASPRGKGKPGEQSDDASEISVNDDPSDVE